jgi:polysaccharide biosynthesis/export protein
MVTVFRLTGNQRTATRFDISAIRDGSAADPAVQSGDIIVASSSLIKETFNAMLKASPLARPLPASK